MEFKIGDRIVFTDEFKKANIEPLKREKHLNTVFIIKSIYGKHIYVTIDGITLIGTHREECFRMATEKEIKVHSIKRKFIL